MNSIVLTAKYLHSESNLNTIAILLLYPITAMIFIGFANGRSALRTADQMELNNFACLVLSGLILQKIVDSVLFKERLFGWSEYGSFDVAIALLDITLMILIFTFQLMLSVCAFVYAARLSVRPVDPEASKAQKNPEKPKSQQSSEISKSQQVSETPKSRQSSETLKSQQSSETLKPEEKSEKLESHPEAPKSLPSIPTNTYVRAVLFQRFWLG